MDKTILKNHLVNNPSDSFWDNLEGAWFFDDGAGTTVTDYSSNGRNATLSKTNNGAYTWDSTSGMEHLSLYWTDSGDATDNRVKATLGSVLPAGDPDATLLIIFADSINRQATGTVTAMNPSKLGRAYSFLHLNDYVPPNRLAHYPPAGDLANYVDTELTPTAYVFRHSNLDLDIYKSCALGNQVTLSALDDSSDLLLDIGMSCITGLENIVDIDFYGTILWSRVLSETEIGYICTALSGTNPWSSHSKFLMMF